MKKLGVCVVYNNNNYGSMLQSFATQKVLEDLKVTFEVIRYKKKKSPIFILKSIPRLINPIIISDKYLLVQKKIQLKMRKDLKDLEIIRCKMFDEFREKYFKNYSPIYYGYRELVKSTEKYDAFLVGSDQLWSPSGLPTNFYNLIFVPDNKPKISYASSFGVKKIPFYQVRRTRNYLNRIESISVRENSGQSIVKELTGRDIPVVVDPTLLYNQSDWLRAIKDETICDGPYIFAYFLGANKLHREEVRRLSNAIGMKIVTIRHMDQYVKADENFGDCSPYNIGPTEFVNLIRHASFVCTDSFHGSVFSILHHKKFITFSRYSENAIDSKNSRIDSILKNLELESRKYNSEFIQNIQRDIDYKKVDILLENFREQSKSYLLSNLKSKGLLKNEN